MRAPLNRSVAVLGTGSCLGGRRVTNDDLRPIVRNYDESSGDFSTWVDRVTHIHERRFIRDGETAATMGAEASRRALEMAGVRAADLDLIVHCSFTPSAVLPGDHVLLAREIGAHRAASFALMAACAGSVQGMGLAYGMVASGAMRRVLVVGTETISPVIDFGDPLTAILFGDGAGAAVVSAGSKDGRGILSTFIKSDGNLASLLYIPGGGTAEPISEKVLRERSHYMKMAGREVFKHAVLTMAEACDEAIRRAGVTPEEIDLLVPHQANIRIIDATARHGGIPAEKVVVTVDRYGNTSAASIPMALAYAESTGRLRPGMLVLLVAFGAGFTWGSAVIRW